MSDHACTACGLSVHDGNSIPTATGRVHFAPAHCIAALVADLARERAHNETLRERMRVADERIAAAEDRAASNFRESRAMGDRLPCGHGPGADGGSAIPCAWCEIDRLRADLTAANERAEKAEARAREEMFKCEAAIKRESHNMDLATREHARAERAEADNARLREASRLAGETSPFPAPPACGTDCAGAKEGT